METEGWDLIDFTSAVDIGWMIITGVVVELVYLCHINIKCYKIQLSVQYIYFEGIKQDNHFLIIIEYLH